MSTEVGSTNKKTIWEWIVAKIGALLEWRDGALW